MSKNNCVASYLCMFDSCLITCSTLMNFSYRDIVKLTAQFVARNGRQFLTNLMNREQV